MTYDSSGIQQEGRIFDIGEEAGISTEQRSKGESRETRKNKRPRWTQKFIGRTEIFHQYWMNDEINSHKSRAIFPDWRQLANNPKARDYKAEWQKKKKKASIQKREYVRRDYVKLAAAVRYREKIKTEPAFAARRNLSRRLNEIMTNIGVSKGSSILVYLGCGQGQLRRHIESMFTKRMSWANYGTYWHVDHILPCVSFDHNDPKQVAQCWHWTNLRPLEAKKNLAKSDSITEPQMQLLLCVTH